MLWGKGFSPQTSSPASATGSFYCHHVQIVSPPPLLENAGVCMEEGPGAGLRWKGGAGGTPLATGRCPALGCLVGRLPTSGLSSSSWPSAKSARRCFVQRQSGRDRRCLWHGGVENGTCSKRVGSSQWDPLRASHVVCSIGMPKRRADGVPLGHCPQTSWLGTGLTSSIWFTRNHPVQMFGKCYCICFVCEKSHHAESKAQTSKCT